MVLKITVEIGGGAEECFGKLKSFKAELLLEDGDQAWTIKQLLTHMRDNMVQQSEEKFFRVGTSELRAGILVFVNECDWDLLGNDSYVIEGGDVITFTSTLHGG